MNDNKAVLSFRKVDTEDGLTQLANRNERHTQRISDITIIKISKRLISSKVDSGQSKYPSFVLKASCILRGKRRVVKLWSGGSLITADLLC